jgi:4-hydroxybenzoate polyprenyltransferase
VTSVRAEQGDVVRLQTRRRPARAALAAMRPRQWSKNFLLFAGIVFAAELGDPRRWLLAGLAFVAYCAASSGAYLVNDVRDAAYDRLHPTKRLRPIARHEVTETAALVLAALLGAVAVALTVPQGLLPLGLLSAFVALQLAYSFGLKHVVLIDVMAIGGLFVIRAAAGAAAVDVRISPWLLLCTALLALFLALAKRRGELLLADAPGRPVLEGYTPALVDQLVSVVAASTIIAYSLYTFTAHSTAMMLTIPFVVFGVFRYLLLVHRNAAGEEPETVLYSDLPILACVGAWTVTAAIVLAVSGA